jgi:hypothetical protein
MPNFLPFKPIFATVPADVPLADGQFIVSDNELSVDIAGERKDVLGGIKDALGTATDLAKLLEEAQGVH